jgi:FtsP/CotA-like multicopper oxidase with cupredoxin domain
MTHAGVSLRVARIEGLLDFCSDRPERRGEWSPCRRRFPSSPRLSLLPLAPRDRRRAARITTIDMIFTKNNAAYQGFNEWRINDVAFAMEKVGPMYHLRQGKRYRLRMRNAGDDIHPVHLHRHSFELTRIAGKPTAGVMKDVVMLGGYQEVEVDFVAENPDRTLFHCHQQLHMDFGFMALFDYA